MREDSPANGCRFDALFEVFGFRASLRLLCGLLLGVTLLSAQPRLVVSPTSLSFTGERGGPAPDNQALSISSTGLNVPFTISTSGGGSWLTVTPLLGVTGTTVTVRVSQGNRPAGTVQATIRVSAAGLLDSPQDVPVTFNIVEPTIRRSPASFSFAWRQGLPDPSPQNLNVTSGGASFSFTASASTASGGNWLSVSPTGGTASSTPTAISVRVSPGSLGPGTYNGTVTISSSGASNSPQTASVQLVVSPPPDLQVSPATLSFQVREGAAAPPAQTVQVSSSGPSIGFTAQASGGDWLSVAPGSGNTTSNLSVSVNPAGLTPGVYTGEISVGSAEAGNSPQTVGVTLTVRARPDLQVSPASLDFEARAGASAPPGQVLRVASSGDDINFTAAASTGSGGNWLSVAPGSGTTPRDLTVSVNHASLAEGEYQGAITIASADAANSPRSVVVRLRVLPAGSLGVSPPSLSFQVPHEGPAPAAQTLSISTDTGAFSFTAAASTASGGGWLAVSPQQGTTPETLSVSIDASSLDPGSYSGTITVTAPGAANSPRTVSVALTVTPVADLSITKTNGRQTSIAGQSVTYTITASNAGPSAVQGATVSDVFPSSLSGIAWNCSGSGGAACPSATGTGHIQQTVTLPRGGSLTYTANATLSETATGQLTNTATISAPSGATDPNPGNNSATDSDRIVAALRITTASLPDADVGTAYSTPLTASGGSPPYSWTLIRGSLPAGLTLDPAGAIRGTPTAQGTSTFTVGVRDSGAGAERQDATRELEITVGRVVLDIVTPSPLPAANQGSPYSVTLAAAGGTAPYTWNLTGAAPPGLSLSPAGRLSGTPAASGTFQIGVRVADSAERTATKTFTLTVVGGLTIVTASPLPECGTDTACSVTLQAAGGEPPYVWSVVSGALPAGLSLGTGGVLQGTPTLAGAFSFTIRVTDAADQTAVKAFEMNITAAAGLRISPATLPEGRLGEAYSVSLTAEGGIAPYTWRLIAGDLPAGLALAPGGLLSGTAEAAGSFPITVEVSDAAELEGARSYTLTISAPPIPVTSFMGLPQTVEPLQQPVIGLRLAAGYPGRLTGRLLLTFTPDAVNPSDDPAVQFSSGGRTVTFEVPPGTTQAVFPVSDPAIQTGSVAGTIRIEARYFQNGADVTPSPAPVVETRLNRGPPVIRQVTLTRTGGGFEARITGWATGRAIQEARFRFTGRPGGNLETTQIVLPLGERAAQWYQSDTSKSFGSQFSLVVPFTVSGSADSLASVAVTLMNDLGTSNEVTGAF